MSETAQKAQETAPVTHGSVWRLAWPIMVSNLAIPLLGLADTAVIGNTGTAAMLGAIAIGATVLTFLYWGFGFLRMGTTGLTAQAFGADDALELRAIFIRAVLLALTLASGLLLLQAPLANVAFPLFETSAEIDALARHYYFIRIWGAPAVLITYGILGWFIGAQDSRPVLILQIFLNGLNILLNLVLVLGLKLGVTGVALGTVIAEWTTLFLGLWLIRDRLRHHTGTALERLTRARILHPPALWHLLSVNRDIMIRTLLLIMGFALFAKRSAELGETTLAANHVLSQLATFSAFFLDGWAMAAEGLVGRAMGARSRAVLHQAVMRSTELAGLTALALTALFFVGGPAIIYFLTDLEEVRAAAIAFLPYAALHPILGVWCFQLDGIFIGATRTKDMRNAMILSFAGYLALWWFLQPFANHGLWLALLAFFTLRGATLAWAYPALARDVERAG